jgi:hypothetical protein
MSLQKMQLWLSIMTGRTGTNGKNSMPAAVVFTPLNHTSVSTVVTRTVVPIAGHL